MRLSADQVERALALQAVREFAERQRLAIYQEAQRWAESQGASLRDALADGDGLHELMHWLKDKRLLPPGRNPWSNVDISPLLRLAWAEWGDPDPDARVQRELELERRFPPVRQPDGTWECEAVLRARAEELCVDFDELKARLEEFEVCARCAADSRGLATGSYTAL